MRYAISTRKSKPVKIYFEHIVCPDNPDAPVIVMQHGDGNDSGDWKSLGYIDLLLKAGFSLVLIDYLGYGKSDKTITEAEAYAMPKLAKDTIAVLELLGIHESVIFFGGSMGATLGYEIATTPKFSSYFDAFILNGMAPTENTIILTFGRWAEEGGMERVVTEMNNVMAKPFPEAVKATFLRNDPKIYAIANSRPWPAYSDEQLKKIDKPVLLACGSESDERDDVIAAAKIIPGAKLAIIPGKDHAQAYWHSDQMVPLMVSFIKSLDLAAQHQCTPRSRL